MITKRRVSAFSSSNLDDVLRGLNVTCLVLAGVVTSGAVLSTLRHVADFDFDTTVLEDLCQGPEVHRVLVEKVFPRQACNLGAGEWIEQLRKSKEERCAY